MKNPIEESVNKSNYQSTHVQPFTELPSDIGTMVLSLLTFYHMNHSHATVCSQGEQGARYLKLVHYYSYMAKVPKSVSVPQNRSRCPRSLTCPKSVAGLFKLSHIMSQNRRRCPKSLAGTKMRLRCPKALQASQSLTWGSFKLQRGSQTCLVRTNG